MEHFSLACGALAFLIVTGCSPSPADCPDRLRCPTGAAGTGGAPSTTSAGGSGGVVFDPCAPTDQSNVALKTCGIFVRNEGSDDNPGTPDLPVATLAKAIALAKANGHVYACWQSFAENLVLDAGVTVHGGLDCDAGWAYPGPGKQLTVLAPSTGVPLSLTSGAAGVRFTSIQVSAPSGGALGGSSIAVIAVGATGVIEDSRLTAGDALSGDDGADASPIMDAPAPDGPAGGNACSASVVAGGVGPVNACDDSIGGDGGHGGAAVGGHGAASLPTPGAAGGEGDPGGAWTCASNAGAGFGHPGLDGASGFAGAGGLSLGQIDVNGYRGADGGNGDPGKAGQGGGGGGGRSGPQCAVGKVGAAGGGGAAGGCGGKGGGGGHAGESSIGILSVDSTLLLRNVVITTGNGGRGGKGGEGQPGALGGKSGPGGIGMLPGCAGGDGGKGGSGGVGGGGRGGHSIGVAYHGKLSTPDSSVTFVVGSEGPGGPSTNGTAGVAGVSTNTQMF